MEAATIKLFLVKGSASSLRTGELSNWSGKAISAPRVELQDLIAREELNSPGVYFLTGIDPECGDAAIYIGEAENVGKRLKQHSDKDFWNMVTVFVSKDDNLTKSHIRYIEGKMIQSANNASDIVVMNGTSSGARLPEADAAEMEVFIAKCLQLLPVMGMAHLNKVEQAHSDPSKTLLCSIKNCLAKGKRTAHGFVVFKGSQAVIKHRVSAKGIRVKRESLVEKGVLVEVGDVYQFSRDMEFGSPSMAASVVRGGNTNGLTSWKDEKGRTLKDIED